MQRSVVSWPVAYVHACMHVTVSDEYEHHLNDSLMKSLCLLQVQEHHFWQGCSCFACFAVGHPNLPDLLDQGFCLPLGHILVPNPAVGLEDPRYLWGVAHIREVGFQVCFILQVPWTLWAGLDSSAALWFTLPLCHDHAVQRKCII